MPMNPPLQQVEEIFEEARQLTDIEERNAFLDRSCAEGLRSRVEELLASLAAADRFFDDGNTAVQSMGGELWAWSRPFKDVPNEEPAGRRIGSYKLLERIGEGGCGVVYMAEQEKPVRRRVALKIIKLGMDTKSVIARFEAE